MIEKNIYRKTREDFFHEALISIAFGKKWKIINTFCYKNIIWEDECAPPTEEEIETELLRLQAEYEATEYQRLRAAAYPKIGDQLDALYHYFEASNITNDFTDMIKVVKDQFPKPTV